MRIHRFGRIFHFKTRSGWNQKYGLFAVFAVNLDVDLRDQELFFDFSLLGLTVEFWTFRGSSGYSGA